MALSWVVSVPGSPSSGVDTSQVRISPSGAKLMALKPSFYSPSYCSGLLRLEASLRCLCSAMSYFRRRLTRAMSLLGDASSGRPVGFSSLGPLRGPTMCLTLTSGQRPGTGRYRGQNSKVVKTVCRKTIE